MGTAAVHAMIVPGSPCSVASIWPRSESGVSTVRSKRRIKLRASVVIGRRVGEARVAGAYPAAKGIDLSALLPARRVASAPLAERWKVL